MAEEVAIITESAANIPNWLATELDINVLPLKFNWAGESLRDGIDVTAEEVYQRQKETDYFPRTNTFTPGELLEKIEGAADHYESVLAIFLPKELTNSIEVARLVNTMEPALPLHIIDSRTAAMAQGFIVLETARGAKGGSSLEEVITTARQMIGRVHFIAAIESLKYLYQSGRINRAQAAVSSALRITPKIRIDPGSAVIKNNARPRTWKKAIERLCSLAAEEIDHRPVHMAVSYVRHPEAAQELATRMKNDHKVAELYINHLTPVMGAVSGPLIALSFYCDD